VFAIPMAWFKEEIVFYLIYLYPFAFLYTRPSHFALPIILACICSIMLIIMLG
jgi:hypothetical protein